MKKILTTTILFVITLAVMSQQKYVGGDISLLPSYEQVKTPYYDINGKAINDVVTYVHDVCHWNACRVRVFIDPVITNADGTKQGEVQDITYITPLCKRIKDAGMALLLDFHYSDTWADPVKQTIPAAWQSLSEEQLKDTIYGYTKMCLETLVAAGAEPDFVQIGNEVSYGMLWRNNSTDAVHAYNDTQYNSELSQWTRFGNLLKSGSRAVKEICPEAQIIIHIERTAKSDMCKNFYAYLQRQQVDFDIIGLSYYPFWHGWLDAELQNTLTALHTAFPDKSIQIVETAYYNNYWPSTGISYDTRKTWPASPAGQDAFLAALINKLDQYDYVDGLYYWFPEENGNGGATWSAANIVITSWLNRGLFDPDKHKALPGLYRLSEFIGITSGLENINSTHTNSGVFTMQGQYLGNSPETLPHGSYIQNGKIIIR